VYAGQVFTGEATFHVGVGTHAHKHRIVLLENFVHGDVGADFGIQTEFHTHFGEDFTPTGQDVFLELEFGNTEGQQAADFRVTIKDHRFDAIAHQHVGATQTGRAGADDGDFLVGPGDLGHVWLPTHGESGVGDVLLGITNGHGTEAVVQGTGAFTQAILGADTTTDFRQGVGLMTQLGRFKDVAFGNQLQPVGNEVVHGALPLAVGIAALEAALALLLDLLLGIRIVNLDVFRTTGIDLLLIGVLAIDLDKLEVIVYASAHGRPPLDLVRLTQA